MKPIPETGGYTIDRVYTLPQVAGMFGVSVERVRQLASKGRIRGAIRPGHEWIIFHGAEILPPDTDLGQHKSVTGAIEMYLEDCHAEDKPATIPPPWWEEE